MARHRREPMGSPIGESSTITLLNRHSIKLTPNDLLLNTQINLSSLIIDPSACSGWWSTRRNSLVNIQTVRDWGKLSPQQDISIIPPPHKAKGSLWGRGSRKIIRTRSDMWLQCIFWTKQGIYTYEFKSVVTVYKRPIEVHGWQKAWKGSQILIVTPGWDAISYW